MAAAKPVVAYDCDGAGEVCLDEKTAYLIAPGDLAKRVIPMLQLSAAAET